MGDKMKGMRRYVRGIELCSVEIFDVTEFGVDDDPLPLVGFVQQPLNLFLFKMFSKILQTKAIWKKPGYENTYFKDWVELLACYGADAIFVKASEDFGYNIIISGDIRYITL